MHDLCDCINPVLGEAELKIALQRIENRITMRRVVERSARGQRVANNRIPETAVSESNCVTCANRIRLFSRL